MVLWNQYTEKMTVSSDFVWNVLTKSENVTHNQELPLSENSQIAEKKSDLKKLLLAKESRVFSCEFSENFYNSFST